MTDKTCPKCGHKLEYHDEGGCNHLSSVGRLFCTCEVTLADLLEELAKENDNLKKENATLRKMILGQVEGTGR